jgi:hypothetical protein
MRGEVLHILFPMCLVAPNRRSLVQILGYCSYLLGCILPTLTMSVITHLISRMGGGRLFGSAPCFRVGNFGDRSPFMGMDTSSARDSPLRINLCSYSSTRSCCASPFIGIALIDDVCATASKELLQLTRLNHYACRACFLPL